VSGGGSGIRLPSCGLSICWFETKTWKREDKLTSQTNTTHNKKKKHPNGILRSVGQPTKNPPQARKEKHTRQEIVVCALFCVCVVGLSVGLCPVVARGAAWGSLGIKQGRFGGASIQRLKGKRLKHSEEFLVGTLEINRVSSRRFGALSGGFCARSTSVTLAGKRRGLGR
jgi:hypothetical protein